jgi:hypothetical protein
LHPNTHSAQTQHTEQTNSLIQNWKFQASRHNLNVPTVGNANGNIWMQNTTMAVGGSIYLKHRNISQIQRQPFSMSTKVQ